MQAPSVTELLGRADEGDKSAQDLLYGIVTSILQRIARNRKGSIPGAQDVLTTELVDDVFLSLVGRRVTTWNQGDSAKFYRYASIKAHDILIDYRRYKRAARRADGRKQIVFEDEDDLGALCDGGSDGLDLQIDLKDSLGRLQMVDTEAAEVFRKRYFLNCTYEEIGCILGITNAAAYTAYARALAWFRRDLRDYHFEPRAL